MTDHYSIDDDHRPMQLPSYRKDNEIRTLKQEIIILKYENRILREKLLEYLTCPDIDKLVY